MQFIPDSVVKELWTLTYICHIVKINVGPFLFAHGVDMDVNVQDPAGIFDLIEVVGNGTYGQVYKVCQ